MKLQVNIKDIKYVNEIDTYWTNEDYKELLQLFDFSEIDKINPNELKEMLFMAITDFEAEEAAKIVLTYKLSEVLNEGQIHNLAYDMPNDKVAEEYPDPELHYDLFNINQLLHHAFNGVFPNTEASILTIEALMKGEMTEEIMTKSLCQGLSGENLLNRLYSDQLEGKEEFTDAAKFIWLLTKKGENTYELMTSKYWIDKDSIARDEYECEIEFFDED